MTEFEAEKYLKDRGGIECAVEHLGQDTYYDLEYHAEVWRVIFHGITSFDCSGDEQEQEDRNQNLLKIVESISGALRWVCIQEKEISLAEKEKLEWIVEDFNCVLRGYGFESNITTLFSEVELWEEINERYEYRGYKEWAGGCYLAEEAREKIGEIIAKNERQGLPRDTDLECVILAVESCIAEDDVDLELYLGINEKLMAEGLEDSSERFQRLCWIKVAEFCRESEDIVGLKTELEKERVLEFAGVKRFRERLYEEIAGLWWFGAAAVSRFGAVA